MSMLKQLLTAFSLFLKPVEGVCQKCGARAGEVFCDRSLLGEPGACVFVKETATK